VHDEELHTLQEFYTRYYQGDKVTKNEIGGQLNTQESKQFWWDNQK
jgi:hypothetical protein